MKGIQLLEYSIFNQTMKQSKNLEYKQRNEGNTKSLNKFT